MTSKIPSTSAPADSDTPQIHTYHCLCSNLLLATTCTLSVLPRRASPGLDSAYILPCPHLPRRFLSSTNNDDDHNAPSDEEDDEEKEGKEYTLLLSLSVPPRQQPILVRRSDGFEKRWVLRCGRCKLAVAYQLDWAQWQQDGSNAGKKGRRDDVLYVLPGAVLPTEQILSGEKVRDQDVDFVLEKG